MPFGFDFDHQDLKQPDWISVDVEFETNVEMPIIEPLKIDEPVMKKDLNIIINEQSRNTTRGGLF